MSAPKLRGWVCPFIPDPLCLPLPLTPTLRGWATHLRPLFLYLPRPVLLLPSFLTLAWLQVCGPRPSPWPLFHYHLSSPSLACRCVVHVENEMLLREAATALEARRDEKAEVRLRCWPAWKSVLCMERHSRPCTPTPCTAHQVRLRCRPAWISAHPLTSRHTNFFLPLCLPLAAPSPFLSLSLPHPVRPPPPPPSLCRPPSSPWSLPPPRSPSPWPLPPSSQERREQGVLKRWTALVKKLVGLHDLTARYGSGGTSGGTSGGGGGKDVRGGGGDKKV